jgi:hypothetical protein
MLTESKRRPVMVVVWAFVPPARMKSWKLEKAPMKSRSVSAASWP